MALLERYSGDTSGADPMTQALAEYERVMNKPHPPLENYLARVSDPESYRTAITQYQAAGGRTPSWYTGNFEQDRPNVETAVAASMTPQQQQVRQEAQQKALDLEEARTARIQLAKDTEARKAKEAALTREGLAQKNAIPGKNERTTALYVLGGVLGDKFGNLSDREQDAAAARAASIAKQQKLSEEGKDVDFESLVSDAYTQMLASGELKMPEEGTTLGNLTHGLIGTQAKPATFKPATGAAPVAPAAAPVAPAAAPSASPTIPPNPNVAVRINSLADFNSLPHGAIYIHPKDGKPYRKP